MSTQFAPIFTDGSPGGIDLREFQRIPYSTNHQIAPYRAGTIPPPDQFFPVRCYDISQGGFSFTTDRLPAMPSLVLGMKVRDKTLYLTAQVVNHRETPEGSGIYVVGCKFTGRIAEAT